jgi:hypothetical protein
VVSHCRGAEVNFIGNTFRAGPDSGAGKAEILIDPVPGGPTGVFVRDNRGPRWREIYGVAPAAGWEKLDEEETAEDEEADHALPPPDAL